ncbi:GNAT family N-acetyltransferase [Halorussus halophilus]|uniref:GNAT family N-acetyltransferase n=1 Tax=Halorussus halophilus TaxID=2650975 RepID=UPI0013014EAC|nr:GNAT family protein [Halorussus halophilus]
MTSDLFPETIETERLVLERLCRENVDTLDFHHCFASGEADPEIFEYIPQEPWCVPKEAHDRIERVEERWNDSDAAEYVVRPTQDEQGAGEIAGTAHLHFDWDRRMGRLGCILREPFWGRGYSGERAGALLKLGFDRLDLELVETGCNAGNENSRRAIEKYVERWGGEYEGLLRNHVPMGDRVDDYHRYIISRGQFERNR